MNRLEAKFLSGKRCDEVAELDQVYLRADTQRSLNCNSDECAPSSRQGKGTPTNFKISPGSNVS